MSNDIKSGNMNDQSGGSKQDSNRAASTPATGGSATDAPKSGQQSQGTAPRTDKGMAQQGGSDQKSGQQSQGGSRADDAAAKQSGSTSSVNDGKKSDDATQKSTQVK